MDSKPAPRQPAQRSGWQAFFASPSTGSVGITIGLALAVPALLNPIFMLPFPVLLGRTLFAGMMLLLVFAAARIVLQAALPRWLPRWVVPVCAVAAAAPFFTAAVYLASVGGSVGSFIDAPSRVAGFM